MRQWTTLVNVNTGYCVSNGVRCPHQILSRAAADRQDNGRRVLPDDDGAGLPEGTLVENSGSSSFTGQPDRLNARTMARVRTIYARDQINAGAWYASTFDRPHNLTIATQWKWSRGWTFGTNFIYTSGRPTTYPNGTYRLNCRIGGLDLQAYTGCFYDLPM